MVPLGAWVCDAMYPGQRDMDRTSLFSHHHLESNQYLKGLLGTQTVQLYVHQ